jgi:hypothetical protein
LTFFVGSLLYSLKMAAFMKLKTLTRLNIVNSKESN